ncbi:MAG: HIT domain-containing protein [Candidatus Doudnabacteria bacterium]|nr:HIT domain-containing protein [Candidatus Doudnabacteria bacterium]
MYNHAPKKYQCPFCSIGKNLEEPHSEYKHVYAIYRDKDITIFISKKQWPKNICVLIIPNKHYENVFDISDDLLAKIQIYGKKVALALKKAYKCTGITIRQHNEPAGNQSVFHYHLQILPRYKNDELYRDHWKGFTISHDNRVLAAKLVKKYFKK